MGEANDVCVRAPNTLLAAIQTNCADNCSKSRGTGVGLVKSIQPAAEIVESVRAETMQILKGIAGECE